MIKRNWEERVKLRLLTAFWIVVVASLGCDAIPINLPDPKGTIDAGYAAPDQDRAQPEDAAAADVLKVPPHNVIPDAKGGKPPGFGDASDAAIDGFWLPDACVDDAIGDTFCPLPPDGGALDAGPGDGGAAAPGLDRGRPGLDP
jgi:hypothetical protein